MPQMTTNVKPENPLEKRIYGVKHFLHGIASTADGAAHEGLITVVADVLEMVEILSVRSVNEAEKIKELKLTGERVMVDPMNPKDLQLALDEIRGQITLHEAKCKDAQAADGMARIHAYFENTSHEQIIKDLKECGADIEVYKPNHFQRYVDLFTHSSAVVSAHRRSGKTTEAVRLAVDYARANPGSKILFIQPKAYVDYNIRRFIPADELESESRWPLRYTLKNGSVIDFRPGGSNKDASLSQIQADRVIVEEASIVSEAVLRELEPILLGNKNKPLATIFFTPLPRYEDMQIVVDCYWNNPRFHRLHYPVTINPDFSREKLNEAYQTCSSSQWACDWLAIVPEKPKEAHRCNCHHRKAF